MVGGLSCSSLVNTDAITNTYICTRCYDRLSKCSFPATLALAVKDEVWLMPLTAQSSAIAGVHGGEGDMQLGLQTLSPGGQTGSGEAETGSNRCSGHGLRP